MSFNPEYQNNYLEHEALFAEIIPDSFEIYDEQTLLSTMPLNPPTPAATPPGEPTLLRVDDQRFKPPYPPDRKLLVTHYNFTVTMKSQTNRTKYLYSSKEHRMYVNMNCDFPVDFNFETHGLSELFVRATMVFSDDANAQQKVERCLQHRHENNANVPDHVKRHVLRSSSAVGTNGVTYHGDSNDSNSWYSVLVEYQNTQHAASLAPLHTYKFVCKNSCNSGINRRATAIVFTLEDSVGTILGRQVVGVRVCSCPRRDLLKDETDSKTRRDASPSAEPKAKKIKIEVLPSLPDDRLCTLPPLQVVGTRAAIAGLEVMIHMMEQARPADPQATASCIASLQNTIQNLKESHQ